MDYFIDTEFLEDGSTIDLISIAVVASDGREFYYTSSEFDRDRVYADAWLTTNVTPHLPHESEWRTRKEIKEALLYFVDQKPTFWAWYADYDWVALCQLFGRMIDLPEHFPKMCMDLKQLQKHLDMSRNDLPSQDGNVHDALADARWNKQVYDCMMNRAVRDAIVLRCR